ncbi:hypothetical protein [Pendulispora albinea]|uniref:Uncharacterized protein n=1 Tax=Pendulispora albinea TaxID=2741071 RepID=A0ABZ2LP67_9BACT
MKQDENGRKLESPTALARSDESPLELAEEEVDETDPSFPARWGERAPGSTRGSLNVSGAPRIDRTNPNFLIGETVANVKPEERSVEVSVEISPPSEQPESKIVSSTPSKSSAKSPKDAVTQDMPAALAREEAVRSAQRELDSNLLLAGIAPAMAPDESGFRQRVKEEESRNHHNDTNDSIDELIDGLPFEASLPRKKSERRRQKDEAERPRRAPLPSLTGQGPVHTGTGDVQEALRAAKSKPPRTGSLVPAGLARNRTPLLGGLMVLTCLLLGAFFVARSTQAPPSAPKSASVAASPAPSSSPAAPVVTAAAGAVATGGAHSAQAGAAAAAADETSQAITSTPTVVMPAAPDPATSTKASLTVRPRPGAARTRPRNAEDTSGLEANPLDDGPRPSKASKPAEPTPAPSASPSPSAEDKLLTGH